MSSKNNLTLKSSRIRVGLTIGDPAGIGPATILTALRKLKTQVDFTVIGDSGVLARAARLLNIQPPAFKIIDLKNVESKGFRFGSLAAQHGKASLEYLDAALGLLKNNKIDCLVTCPVSKAAVNLAGFKFCGHTEYLGQRTKSPNLVMMLINERLKFSLLTRHVRLAEVSGKLKTAAIAKNILATVDGLRIFFSVKKPRLAICGINPHASDGGLIGCEEQKIIIPAMEDLTKKFKSTVTMQLLAADAAIFQAAAGKFDCVIAAYHDQALIALKLTGFESGVNLTLGLPFVRTSPLHGVAFDIANQPALANPSSLIAAIQAAIQCTLNRKKV